MALSTYVASNSAVMPGLVPGIHALASKSGVDGRDKPGHDVVGSARVGIVYARSLRIASHVG